MEYRIVSEWACPTYYDYKTNETLYDECSSSAQRLWVVSYDTENKEIIEWLQDFTLAEEDKANDYIEKLKGDSNAMKQAFNDLTTEYAISAREYFMVLRLAIYHIDRKYIETSAEIAQYPMNNELYRCAIEVLKGLKKGE